MLKGSLIVLLAFQRKLQLTGRAGKPKKTVHDSEDISNIFFLSADKTKEFWGASIVIGLRTRNNLLVGHLKDKDFQANH